jgi:hypothetical protein
MVERVLAQRFDLRLVIHAALFRVGRRCHSCEAKHQNPEG